VNGTLLKGSVLSYGAVDSLSSEQAESAEVSPTASPEAEPQQAGQPQSNSFWSHIFSYESAVSTSQPSDRCKSRLSRSSVTVSALKSLKPSHFFEGLSVSPNFKFLMLLACLVAWLFVVDFVRKNDHEQHRFSSKTLDKIGAATQYLDHAIVGGIKKAYPNSMTQSSDSFASSTSCPAPGPGQAQSANYNSLRRFGLPGQSASSRLPTTPYFITPGPILHPTVASASQQIPLSVASGKGNSSQYPPAYNVQLNSFNGPCLKTIVSR
jgi:hypothetical protein